MAYEFRRRYCLIDVAFSIFQLTHNENVLHQFCGYFLRYRVKCNSFDTNKLFQNPTFEKAAPFLHLNAFSGAQCSAFSVENCSCVSRARGPRTGSGVARRRRGLRSRWTSAGPSTAGSPRVDGRRGETAIRELPRLRPPARFRGHRGPPLDVVNSRRHRLGHRSPRPLAAPFVVVDVPSGRQSRKCGKRRRLNLGISIEIADKTA